MQTIFLFFYLTAFGQIQKTTTINLTTADCRSDEAHSWEGIDTVTFYKLPENKIVSKIIPRQYRQFPIKLENIPISEYKVIFKNNFQQLIVKQINLMDRETNFITLCPDALLDYPQNILLKLQDKDTISINFHSQGCFHNTLLKILIIKKNGIFIAKLCNVVWYYEKKNGKTTMQYGGDSILKTVTLTNKNIQAFKRFENELNYVKAGGCTTTDWYDIKSKYLNTKKIDGSCTWNGFYYLRESFFGDKE